MHKNDGFTLIELIVVLIIIGIFAAMALPPFLRIIRQQEVHSTAQNIADLINYARTEASRRNQVTFIYPAYFKTNALLNGQATSWSAANGMVVFVDKLNHSKNNIAKYDSGEEIKSFQVKKNTITLIADVINSITSESSELGLVVYPNGKITVLNDYRGSELKGSSVNGMRIVVTNKIDKEICHVLWVDGIGKARSCPSNVGKNTPNTPENIKNICTCTTIKTTDNE